MLISAGSRLMLADHNQWTQDSQEAAHLPEALMSVLVIAERKEKIENFFLSLSLIFILFFFKKYSL